MRTTSKLVKALAAASALLPFCNSGLASIVYDNSTTDLNQSYGVNAVEFGDQITLAGTDRLVTDFRFEYFLSANAGGNETAQLILYANDGALVTRTLPDNSTIQVASPGTVLYTSSILTLQTGYQIAEAAGLSITVPDSFTWAVTLNGVDSGEIAGLRLYDPPTVGSSFADFWQRSGGTWNTFVFPDGTAGSFGARVTAIPAAVPEPTTLALGLIAGLGFFGYRSIKRRS